MLRLSTLSQRSVVTTATAAQCQQRAFTTASATLSAHSEALSQIAAATKSKSAHQRKKFDPKLIYPSKAGSVRICNNTTRDAQQSNLSAEMATLHRMQIATLIDDCYTDIKGPTGVEQIWGGTIPMFDIWKRGSHPFDSLREMTTMLPNTPTSMLVRSNSLNSMNSQPADVIDAFIKHSCDAGINVFTNFDAHNDIRNHHAVANAVHKYGQHYQAALSWAVARNDPTIYNVQWAVNWFGQIVKELDPHSLYVKDPSGVLTPEMAGLLARELKAEFPHLPLIFHSHYQTGFAYAAYLEAARNGANGVECSLGFSDGAGQPYSLAMLRMCEDYGLETGSPDKEKWNKINLLCKNIIRPVYASANVVRTPDISVELTGIAGGQRSILDKELIDAGQGHLIPRVDEMVQQVRREGGMVCQVTPAADSYAREAMRRIRGGDANSNFTPGYAQILMGENGSTKEPVNAEQRKSALNEKAVKRVDELVKEGKLQRATAATLLGVTDAKGKLDGKLSSTSPLAHIRTQLDALAAPVISLQRRNELTARLEELAQIKKNKPDILKSLNLKIALVNETAKEGSVEACVRNVDDRIVLLKKELEGLSAGTEKDVERYHALLLGKASEKEYQQLLPSNFKSSDLTLPLLKDIVTSSGVITCSSNLLLAPGLGQSLNELKAFDAQHTLGLLDTPLKQEENTTLWSCFNKAAIPNLLQNFFLHYYTGDITGFFPKLYKGDKEHGHDILKGRLAKLETQRGYLIRNTHSKVEKILREKKGKDYGVHMAHVKELIGQIDVLEVRADKWADQSVESSRITPQTKQALKDRITTMKSEVKKTIDDLTSIVHQYMSAHPHEFATQLPVFDSQKGKVVLKESQVGEEEKKAVGDVVKQIVYGK